ncbi:hypothetical protein AB5I41_31325 [Sphingomonas sp. MMS24-JH45]
MARLSEQHIGKCGLTGKCSVPMFSLSTALPAFAISPLGASSIPQREPSRGQSGRYADPVWLLRDRNGYYPPHLAHLRPPMASGLRWCCAWWPRCGRHPVHPRWQCGALSGRGSSTLPKASRASAIRKTRRKPTSSQRGGSMMLTGREAVDAYSAKWRTDKMLVALFGPDALSIRNAEGRAGENIVARMTLLTMENRNG